MPETLLAFDFGTRRIGVAVGTYAECGRLATARALTTIDAAANDARFSAIGELVREWQPTRLVVGEPRHADGTAHDLTARSIRFADQLRGRFRLPVDAIDERLSSVAAEESLREDAVRAGRRPSRRIDTARIDAKLADGVLKLTLPKSDRAKARQITIS